MAELFTRDGARKRVEPLSRKLKAAFTERRGFKLTALFFAFLLWLMLSAEEPTEELRMVRLSLVTDTLVELETSLPEVRALVSGPRRELLRLNQDPPVIRRVITGDTPAVDTLELRAADVDVGAAEVRVRDVQPRHVPVRFRVSATRTVPVTPAVRLVPDTGVAILGPPRVEPARVRISGPRERVRAIDSVYTTRVELIVSDTLSQVIALDTAGLGVSVEPMHVRVTVPATRIGVPDTLVATPLGAPNEGTPPPR